MIVRPEASGELASNNNDDCWVFRLAYDPSKGTQAADFSVERCKTLLRIALGMSELDD